MANSSVHMCLLESTLEIQITNISQSWFMLELYEGLLKTFCNIYNQANEISLSRV
jgi:hypothetical protein